MTFRVLVQIPALDRYLDWLEAQDDTQDIVNGLTVQVKQLTQRLQVSSQSLDKTLEENKT